ncbi:MAG TPA: protein kinase [Polyangia bacterium]|jgi:WD40 repeat protein|nr:protein kinase [Polyangia bacterium]
MYETEKTELHPPADAQSPPEATPRSSGDLLAALPPVEPGRYQVVRERGRGGLGRILEVHDRRLGRQVAIKELLAGGGDGYRRFAREALITARLEHPAIVPVHDAGRWPSGEPFYAMKFVSGRSLQDTIARATTLDARLALIPNLVAVADAIAYAHSHRIIHRDLKPANVLIGPFGETVVIDWGLAKDLRSPETGEEPTSRAPEPLDGESLTQTGAVMGTPAYISPEQARGHEVDERADVYSLGAMLYHALSGRPPYEGPSGRAILAAVLDRPPVALTTCQPGVPDDLAAIVQKAMARDPALRYPSAGELAEDLRRFQTGRLVSARQYSRSVLIGRWLRRHRVPASIAGLALALLGVVGAASIRRIVAARHLAEQRANALLLAQARTALERDPTEALAWLRTYPGPVETAERPASWASSSPPPATSVAGWDEVRALALEADRRGIARHVLGRDGFYGFAADGRGWFSVHDGRLELRDIEKGTPKRRFELPGNVDRVEASADRRHVGLFDDRSGRLVLLDLASGREQPLSPEPAPVSDFAFSPDGRWLATGERDGSVHLWPLGGGEARALGRHDGPVVYVVFSGDSRRVFSGARESAAGRLWDIATPRRDLVPGPPAKNTLLTLAPDASRVALVEEQNELWLWEAATGTRRRLGAHAGRIHDLSFSPDGTILASAGDDGAIFLWSQGRAAPRLLTPPHTGGVNMIGFTPDGRHLCSVGKDGEIRSWSVASGAGRVLGRELARLNRIEFTSDGRYLATRSRQHAARLWELPEDIGARLLQGHRRDVYKVVFSPDGRLLATASLDQSLRWWDLATGQSGVLRGHENTAGWIAFAPHAPMLASGSYDHTLRLWDLGPCLDSPLGPGASCPPTGRVLTGHQGTIRQFVFTPDGRRLVSAGDDGMLRVWDLIGGTSRALTGHRGPVLGLLLLPDARHVASAGEDGLLRLWDLETGAAQSLTGHNGPILALAASPDGRQVASAGQDQTVRLWQVPEGTSRLLGRHEAPLRHLAFRPDGRELASAAEDGSLRLWTLADGSFRSLEGHREQIHQLAFAADGTLLASASQDHSVRLWNVGRGVLADVFWHETEVYSAAFSPDGSTLAAAGADGAVWLWPARRTKLPEDPHALRAWMAARSTAVLDSHQRALTPR